MKRSMMVGVVGLMLTTMLLGPGTSVMAQDPEAEPRNPEYLEFRALVDGGLYETETPEGTGLGAVPPPVNMSHNDNDPPEPPPSAPPPAGGPGTPVGVPPASYDLRTLGRLTPVKDQLQCGSCWSFATYGSEESCLLLVPETRDFSEMDLICNHGFDYLQCFGGHCWMSTAYLARWDGPVNETCYPYNTVSPYNCTIPRPSCPVQKHIQEVDFIPDRADTAIKNAIMNDGAVYTTIFWDMQYYNSSTYSYYCNNPAAVLNHAVCIVGWDDNYAASNFLITPPGNGAFIIRNSWGPGWHQGGYFYCSYYDTKIGRDNALFRNSERTTNYLTRYDYDPLGWTSSMGYGSITAWCANIFMPTANENLVAVTTYADTVNTSYEVWVYTNVTGGASGPRSGLLAPGFPQTGTWAMPGYQRINLGTSVALTMGQPFSIVLKLTTPGNIFPVPYEEPVPTYSSLATATAGQSYISPDGINWMDMTSFAANANVCIKGFTGIKSPNSKWLQEPDQTSYGMDVRVDSGDDKERVIADDFECTSTSLLTDVHLWGSWKDDIEGQIENIHLSIHSDDPVGPGGSEPDNTYSKPDELLWEGDYSNFTISLFKDLGQVYEDWWDPFTGLYTQTGDHKIWKIDIDIPQHEAFLQTGSAANPVIYWLDVAVDVVAGSGEFGWKTRDYTQHFMDDAVWAEDDGSGQLLWNEMRYPSNHELYDQSVDMAFELTFQPAPMIEFSLDIGSDTELSDPYVDGDEGFDPGDIYLGGPYFVAGPLYSPVTPPAMAGGRDGYKDDAMVFFQPGVIDPYPDPPDATVPPTTAVPVGNDQGVDQYLDYLDVDGHDQLSFSLEAAEFPMSIEEHPDADCIYYAKYLQISYDDDMATSWSGVPADVPVTVSSTTGFTYGRDTSVAAPNWDELIGLEVAPTAPYPYMILNGPVGIADEKGVHPDLKPDPTVDEKDDDDVDSLDIVEYDADMMLEPGTSACPYYLFSVDHEAHMGLDPGHIYEVDMSKMPQITPVVVVDHNMHLGLPLGVDIDAFEFVWSLNTTQGSPSQLALLFSVDENDPLTPADETGGLVPSMIYISFLNGTFMDFISQDFQDDIDALSNWNHDIYIPDSEPPAINTAVSCKEHDSDGFGGAAGPVYCIDVLDRTNNQDVECRQYSTTRVVVEFDENVQRVNNNLTDVTLTSGTVTAISISGTNQRELTVDMTNTTNGAPLKISFPGIADADNISLVVTEVLCIRQFIGDVRPTLVVDVFDRLDVRNQMIYPVSASNFRADVRSDGVIDVFDRLDVRNAMLTAYAGTCP